jgi:hypothetical protein
MRVEKRKKGTWYSFSYKDAKEYENRWSIFGKPKIKPNSG